MQPQAYDNVLKDDDRTEEAFHGTCEYIARNPERAGLVEIDKYAQYKYAGCIVLGNPELKPFADDFWTRFWRVYSYLRKNGLLRVDESSRVVGRRIRCRLDFGGDCKEFCDC